MPNKKTIIKLTLVFTLLFAAVSQIEAGHQDVSATRAIQLFEKGEFDTALPLFKTLLKENPENPLLNYYYGASRTETEHFSESDLQHLLNARGEEIPGKVNYYLGLQHHAKGDWTKALKYYNQFQLKATNDERTDLKIAEKIQQCFNRENPFTWIQEEEPADSEKVTKTETQEIARPEKITKLELVDEISLSDGTQVENVNNDEPIEFPLNSNIVYYNTSNFKNEEARELFQKTEQLKNELDFSLNEMEELRKKYRSVTDEEERQTIGGRILAFENESFDLRNEISQSLVKVRQLENEYWQNATQQEIEAFSSKSKRELAARKQKITEPEPDVAEEDNSASIDPELILEETETIDILGQPEEKEDELVYKIQIGAYSRGLPSYVDRLFKKLSLIRKIDKYTDEKGVVVYTTGNLQNMEDAVKMRDQVRQEGVEDAFVVPYFQGKRITLEEAKKLETGS